ncbi:MAG TPA: RagB/SusD family nutrient uptake outer membrane protein [Chitinophagaceae bacterium]|nr:RagB/SusD family nutrient uptake outer membrane protein [Chitinophagaceae bacterium]
MNAKYIYWTCALSLCTFLGACTKVLDQLPKAEGTKATIFGNENGLAVYSNSFYTIIPSAGDIMRGDNMCDYAVRTQVPDFLRPGVYSAIQSSGWDWGPLRNINYFIENCTDPKISVTVRENYIGLARFFRAWWYFQMVKKFGDVPWYSKTLAISDTTALYKPRDPRTLVMDSVLADLDYACAHITLTDDKSRTLITKWIAYALKSRICLYAGTFRKYHTEYNLQSSAAKWLTEAAQAAKVVMDSSGFSLNQAGGPTESYRELFINTAPVANEVMLVDAVDPSLGVFDDANWYWTSATYGDRLSFDRTFVNTYLNLDGTPFTSDPGYQTMTFMEETKNRDDRLQQTIRTPGYTRLNGGAVVPAPPAFSYTYTGYQPIKYALDDEKYDQGNVSVNSIPVIRYAEILLNYAEAKAELGTLTDEDWANTIGALRARAGITGGLTTKPTQVDPYLQSNYFPDISNPVILEIRRCRSIELAWEGFRFDDLVRWKRGGLMEQEWNGFYVPALNKLMDLDENGTPDVSFVEGAPANPVDGVKYIDVSPMVNGKENPMQLTHGTYGEITWLKDAARVWNDKMYLYPIPESALLKNSKLGQNPGW